MATHDGLNALVGARRRKFVMVADPRSLHDQEVARLIDILEATERRLEALTSGEAVPMTDSRRHAFVIRRSEDQLRNSEASRQAALLNSLPQQIAWLDAGGLIIFANRAWIEFALTNGLDASDVVGAGYLDVCDRSGASSEEAAPVAAGIRSVLTGEAKSFQIEYPCHSPTEQHWFSLTVTPLSEDLMDGAVVVRGDVTDRKLAELALAQLTEKTAQRERLLSTMLGAISDFSYIFDAHGRFLFVNEPLLKLWGLTLEEAVGKNMYDLNYPDELAAKLHREIDEVIETEKSVTGETPYVAPDGHLGFYEYIFSAVVGEEGVVEFVVGTTRDITERKRHEQALLASNRKFQVLADNITDVFWIRSADMSAVHYLSPAFEKIWGRKVESFLADPEQWMECVVPEDRERVNAGFASLRRDGPSIDLEYRISRPDGEIRWVRARGFQVRDDQGVLMYMTGIVTDTTERQAAAQALRTSEQEFRTLAEAMPQIVWITRADGSNIYFNQRWMDYTGLTLEESSGDGWITPFHPDDRERSSAAWQEATSSTGQYSIESRLRGVDGTYRWWLVRGSPLLDEAGAILKWFGTCTDIHDLKLAELEISMANRNLQHSAEALRVSESEQRKLAEALELERSRLIAAQEVAKVGSWETNLETMEVHWSDATYRIFETDPATPASRQRFLKQLHSDDREMVDRALFESTSTLLPSSVEHRLVMPDGRIKFIEERWQVWPAANDRPLTAIGTCQDITERKVAEVALQQSQQRLRDVFDGLGPSVFVALLTPAGVVVEINRAPLEAAGLQSDDVVGNRYAETRWWSHSPEVQQQLLEAIKRAAAGESSRYDVCIRGAGDAVIDVDFSLEPLRDSNGEVIFLTTSAIVITERKLAEAALRRVQKLEAVGQLAAGVAHEFNNILQTLMSMATVTRHRSVDLEVVRIAEDMETQIRRGADVTRQLLLSARDQEPKMTRLDLRAEVTTASELLRRLIPENIAINVETSSECAAVDGDAGQLQQVLLNLAINARDAMPDGGVLTLRVMTADGEVSVDVEDTGEGFNDATREHLFEPFFTTKDVGKGSGLGLAVVYGIVEQHGGRIDVSSTPGVGSRFRVILPESSARELEAETPSDRPLTNATGRILLVEDEETVRDGLTMLLEMIGYEVTAVGRGEDAIALPALPAPDLLLSDVSLPGIGGTATAGILETRWPELGVVLMTGYLDPHTRDLASRRGWTVLPKPFAIDELAALLAEKFPRASRQTPS